MINKLCIATVLVLGPQAGTAMPPEDSVLSRKYATRSAVSLDLATHTGHSIVLDQIPFASQTIPDTFVKYGPFVNSSRALLTISMKHLPSPGDHDVTGWINGTEVASDSSYISFQVPPGAHYHLVVKGAAMVTMTADQPGLTATDIGVPRAADFLRPRGKFVKCVDYRDFDQAGRLRGSDRVYYYAEGSMSDKSQSFDSLRGRRGFTTGVAPPDPVVCETLDSFDPGS